MKNKILIDREKRMDTIREVISNNNCFVVVVKSNICGDNKNIKEANMIKKYFLNEVCNKFDVLDIEFYESYDGNYYLVKIKQDDEVKVKSLLVEIEETALGRYIDLDLYTNLEKSITRSDLGLGSRKCVICGEETISCMRSMKHTVDEVLAKTISDIRLEMANIIANYSSLSMREEVMAHPKFGLVSEHSNGKHTDMDINTFNASIEAIKPFLVEYALEGYNLDENSFSRLREIGKRAEVAMFNATNNINTHKGSIFILGFIIPSIIDCIYNNKDFSNVSQNIKYLAKDIMSDFSNLTKATTYGEEAFLKYNITGVRGEVKEGLVKVFEVVNNFKDYPGNNNQLVLDLLCTFMSFLNDTVILHTNEVGFLEYVKSVGEEVIEAGGSRTSQGMELIEEYTSEFIDANISPGGSADMVIASLLLLKSKETFWVI